MKLWLLLSRDDAPVHIWDYNTTAGFVIRARTEGVARQMANDNSIGDENKYHPGGIPWLDPDYTTCEELRVIGQPEIILIDFRAG